MQKLSEQWVTDFQRFGKTNMDFVALQQKLFDLDPSDRAEDLRRLTESVGDMPQESAQTEENFLQESVEVQEGTMPVEGDYSLSDFAALAGVTLNESQKTGSAGQLKGKDPMPKAKARGKHPHVNKLVGEADDDDQMGVWDTVKTGYAKGKKDYNNIGVLDPFDNIGKFKKIGTGSSKKPDTKPSRAPAMDANTYKQFLKQHTVGLKAIAVDPKKKAQFDQFMTKMGEGVEEGIVDIATKVADKATQGVNSVLGKIENWYNSQKAGNDLAWAEVEPFLKPYAQELKDLIQDKRDMQMLMFMLERNQINKGFIRNLFDKIKRKGLRAVYKMEKEFGGFATEGDGRKPKMPKTRNPVASHAQSSGSGVHADQNKKKQPMRKDKHKKQLDFATESIKEMLYRKLNAKK